MSETIEFEISHAYDTREVGITIKTKLTHGKEFNVLGIEMFILRKKNHSRAMF